MTQCRIPLNKLFIYTTYKSKNKRRLSKPTHILNLKNECLDFLKQTNGKTTCLKKINAIYIKISRYF